ncbi:MAG: dTMP kinase [Dehalococcoidia bacterium]|nr:dTMP kinase [Dehalococcoidia bacterium]
MFVVLEGGEGAGKSTLAAALAKRIEAAGRDVVLTREPGGTHAGELVRTLLHEPLPPWGETFAFLVARAQLVAEVVRPALVGGAVVLCDRFAGSTFAYQGYGRGLDLAELRRVNALATGGLEPDLVLYLDLPPEAGLARKHGEAEAIRTGLEGLVFHERVREGFRAQAAADPKRWVTLDATVPADAVAAAAWAALGPRLG